MPKTVGWERPDIESMSKEELTAHLELMRAIGEGYRELYALGQFPPSIESWGGWWARTTPEFVVFYPQTPDKDILVSEMMAKMAANPPDTSKIKSVKQEDVNIHPFPGGCIFEQTMTFTLQDGTVVRSPGVHIFYANAEGKIVRSHEYYDSKPMKDAGIDMALG